MIKSFFDKKNINYEENASLKKYNTYRLDTKCKYLVFPNSEEELITILKEIKKDNLKYLILGNGSNVIFSMDYYDGIIIKLDKLNSLTINDTTVSVGAGYSLIKLALETVDKGLEGLEFAAGIPGQVGASTAMNAGAYKSDMSEVVESVRFLNDKLEIIEFSNEDMAFEYRNSYLKQHPEYIVLSTTLKLKQGDTERLKELITERRNKRLETQPLDMPSAGSVFRNPEGMHAGELIEKSNLKGYNINGAEVSKKHANFIINTGNATGKDIIKLINIITEKVNANFDVDLKLEQIIIE